MSRRFFGTGTDSIGPKGTRFIYMSSGFYRKLLTITIAPFLFAIIASIAPAQAADQPSAPQAHVEKAYPLKRLILGDTPAALENPAGLDGANWVIAINLPLLASEEFAKEIAAHRGTPISMELINALCTQIRLYLQKKDRIIVNFDVPSQTITGGDLRISVKIGRYRDVIIRGNRWFSKGLLESKIGIKPGDEILLSTLEEGVNWVNSSPFRHIKVLINDAAGQVSTPDLIVQVAEATPLRFMGSYDDTGNEIIGKAHYTAGIQYGNLWGLDHLATYQFITTDYRKLYQVHSLDYRIPLPWRHHIQAMGAYSLVQPTFGNGFFTQKGTSVLGNIRYLMPLEKAGYSFEFSAGVDFKQSNNNLEFGGETVLASKHEVIQLSLSATAVRKDSVGAWVGVAGLSLSPGRMTERNSDTIFANTRVGANPRYAVANFQLQRVTQLPGDFQLQSRLQAQFATSNLVGSEQMTIGGTGSVRGYDDRLFSGDNGMVLSHELLSPILSVVLPKSTQRTPPLNMRLVAFWDYARVSYYERIASDIDLDRLMGTGIGVRAGIGQYFNLSADYGWQVKELSFPQTKHGRAHVRISASF